MKKIVLILLAFFCLSATYSQVAVISGSSEIVDSDYPSILDDGDTRAWYEATSDYITESSGDVSQWDDRSGNDYDLVTVAGSEPEFSGDSIYFDQTNDYLVDTFTNDQPVTFYIVMKAPTWTSRQTFISGSGTSYPRFRQDGVSPNVEYTAGVQSADHAMTVNEWVIVRLTIDDLSSQLQVNGTSYTAETAGNLDFGGLTIGSQNDGGARWSDLRIKELILRGVADDATDRGLIIDYLNDKYSIY